jgi:PAS domain S-box-containing protein
MNRPGNGGASAVVVGRQPADDALREQAALLDNAQRIGGMGSWSLDLRTGRVVWPEATCRLHGITPREFDGTVARFHSFILPEDLPAYEAAEARLSVSEPLFEVEYRIRRADGVVRWMYSRGQLEVDDAGAMLGRVGMVMDITGQHEAREQLAENAALLRIAGRIARMGGWTIQLPDRTLFWSDENCAIHDVPPGYKPTLEEGLGYYPAEYRASVLQHVDACERDGTPYDFELPKNTATGRRIWVRSIGEAVRNADGRIVRIQGAFQDISARKAAEEALGQRDAEFRILAESMPQMVWMTRPDGRTTYVNQRWLDYTGLTLEESHGHGWAFPFHPDDQHRISNAWQRAIVGADYTVESRLRRADGTYRWMLVRGLPFRDSNGILTKWIGTCTDIDDLKQAQEAAVASERAQRELAAQLETERARLVAAQAVARVGSWETDLSTLDGIWSAETYRIFETDPERVPLTHAVFLQLVHPEDRARVDNQFVRSMDTQSSSTMEHRLLMPDGRIKFVEERWQIVCDENGRPHHATGTCQDITERRTAQDAIRMQAHMLDHIGQAVIATDTVGRVTYANRVAAELYGWCVDEMLGRLITEITVPQASREQSDVIMRHLRRGETWSGELQVQSRDGRVFPALITESPVLDGGGEMIGIVGISTDISARKQLELQAFRAQRMESIGTLAGGIAHDLNNVLAPILLSIAVLQQDEDDAARLATLDTIEASAKRGAAMIDRVLSFARGREGRRVDVQVMPLVRELATIVRDTFPKNIAFEDHVSPDLWSLQADPTQLHQVLLNLCVNARDAMATGGKITITARNLAIDESYAAVNIDARVGPYVTLDIEDTGTGISSEIIDKIFDPFFTTKEIGKGTGLGLATSLAIVKGHDGFMRAHSEGGRGARFRLYLPAHTTPAAIASPVAVKSHPKGTGETVLVVDDEEFIRQIVQRTLQNFGYRVLLAKNGVEALAVYAQHQAEIAVVLTDMMMPVMDGPATIRELLRVNPAVRIIAASGLNAGDEDSAGRVACFLPKPYSAETLLTAIREALS